jgi:trans-2,3-dihydro-3-hydroxyanthranilate isomerase
MSRHDFYHVDVFTDRPFAGNQLAVFPDGRGLSAEQMQALAIEINFAETTFVLPPEDSANNFKVRIFTPGAELPMAGHPTVGTAYVLAREGKIRPSGGRAEVRFEEGVGPIPVTLEFEGDKPGMITMTQPRPTFGPTFENRQAIAEMLSLDASDIEADLPIEMVSCGVPFLYVPLRNLDAIKRVQLRTDVHARELSGFPTHELFLFTREVENPGSTVHSRMFAPGLGVVEDAATGAASGPLGCYMVRYGLAGAKPLARIVSEQGIEMGRPSFIHIEVEQSGGEILAVRVGGRCHYMGQGFFELE